MLRIVVGVVRAGHAVHHERREVACGVAGVGAQGAEAHRRARRQLLVVRDPHDVAHPRLEVRLDLREVVEDRAGGRRVDRDDGVRGEVGQLVRLEPVDDLRREPRLVGAAARDHDESVGALQGGLHDRLENAAGAVGQDDRVEPLRDIRDDVVGVAVERVRLLGVGIRRQHLEAGAVAADEVVHVVGGPEARGELHDIPHARGRGLGDPLGQRPAVGVGVDGEHAIVADLGQRHPEQGRDGRRADAALAADDRDEPGTLVHRARDARLEPLARSHGLGVADVHERQRDAVDELGPEPLGRVGLAGAWLEVRLVHVVLRRVVVAAAAA